ncbi:DUF3137 domain-containing protein [Rubritalea marina]|uniref:DUF3137 domain-containing protein n=1 Tax=Rubritalea marina TaxID=361055 RepID=UPI00035D6C46|nr:DUF3137 domain-containing protein [Rubritalea marina]
MNIPIDIQAFIQQRLDQLEKKRLSILKLEKRATIEQTVAFTVFTPLFVWLLQSPERQTKRIEVLAMGILFLAWLIRIRELLIRRPRIAFAKSYKDSTVGFILQQLYPGLNHEAHKGIPFERFQSTGLIKSEITQYSSEDLIRGSIDSMQIAIGEVNVHSGQIDSTTVEFLRSSKFFYGIYLEIEIPQSIEHKITVAPREMQGYLGWNDHHIYPSEKEVKGFQQQRFNKAYVVRSGGPEETHRVLTPALQDQILSLRKKIGKSLMLCFQQSKVVVIFEINQPWFEPSIRRPCNDFAAVQHFADDIALCLEVVDSFNRKEAIRNEV